MRPELELIEKIEQYLNGKLSPADNTAFEAQLAADPNLREQLRLQSDIRAALQRTVLATSVRHARQHYHAMRWLRWGGFSLGVAVVAIGTLLMLTRPWHSGPKSGLTSISGEIYTIDLTRDTILKTRPGALLRIPRGSIDARGATTIRIAIKEAYTIADMIRYGLTTRSDGQPLSSGGMIDIRPVDADSARIIRPVAVSLPTGRIEEGMNLYKGSVDNNGKVNWVDPRPLSDTTQPTSNSVIRQYLAEGRTLFETHCSQCHSVAHIVTGPALAYIEERRPQEWLFGYIRDNRKMLSYDCYSQYIYNAFNKTPMNTFPSLTDKSIDQILLYIGNQSQLIDSNKVTNYTREFDSCRQYRRMAGLLEKNRLALITANENRTEVRNNNSGTAITDTPIVYTSPAAVTTVTPVEHPSIYYTFTVESFGWYNVDALLKGLPGIQQSELRVSMTAEYAAEVNVFLAIPGRKVLAEGGFLKDSKTEFCFYTEDGQIPLPQGEQAYVFATGEYQGKLVFAIRGFTVERQQSIELQPMAMTKTQIADIVAHLDLNQLSIRVDDSRNAAKIRVIDTSLAAIARFKPQHCDCDCRLDEPRDSSWGEKMPAGATK